MAPQGWDQHAKVTRAHTKKIRICTSNKWLPLSSVRYAAPEKPYRQIPLSYLTAHYSNMELVEVMWQQFQDLGAYESNVIDTTECSLQETVSIIKKKICFLYYLCQPA